MKHTDLSSLLCPVASSLNRVGEWWSIMILRDALMGFTRFDEFQKSLAIAPNILTRRLNDLVASGLLVKTQYCQRPPRYEYLLTKTGGDFHTVMMAFVSWGNRHYVIEGHSMDIVDLDTGLPVRLGLVDLNTGQPITRNRHRLAAGPAASERMRYRFDYIARKRAGGAVDLKFQIPPRLTHAGKD